MLVTDNDLSYYNNKLKYNTMISFIINIDMLKYSIMNFLIITKIYQNEV